MLGVKTADRSADLLKSLGKLGDAKKDLPELKIRNPIKLRDAITGTYPIWIWRFISNNNKLWLAEIEVSMFIIGSEVIKTNKKGAKFKRVKSHL